MPVLFETERLILREFEERDSNALFMLNNDPEVLKYTGDPPFQSEKDALSFIRSYDDYRSKGMGRWAVLNKKDHSFIGWCGLKKHEDGMIDLGFRFYRKEWGKGYATESAAACLDFGIRQMGLREIVGRAARENKASIRVLEKIGMKYWKDDECDGIADAVYYRYLIDDI